MQVCCPPYPTSPSPHPFRRMSVSQTRLGSKRGQFLMVLQQLMGKSNTPVEVGLGYSSQ